MNVDEDPIILKLIESETQIYPSRIVHVKDNNNELENPYNDDSDNSSFEYNSGYTDDITEDEGDNEPIEM